MPLRHTVLHGFLSTVVILTIDIFALLMCSFIAPDTTTEQLNKGIAPFVLLMIVVQISMTHNDFEDQLLNQTRLRKFLSLLPSSGFGAIALVIMYPFLGTIGFDINALEHRQGETSVAIIVGAFLGLALLGGAGRSLSKRLTRQLIGLTPTK